MFEASDADVVVAADADTLIPHDNLRTAAEWAFESPGLVQPFDEWVWCSKSETAQILTQSGFPRPRGVTRLMLRDGHPLVGTCNVLSRETWELAGGWLPGFRGWGCEDIAFYHQTVTLAGPLRRLSGPAVHLYHPKTGRYVDEDVVASNSRLMHEVHAVAGDPEGMSALISAYA